MAMKEIESEESDQERQIIEMCERALRGDLPLEEVWAFTGAVKSRDPFMTQVLADLEDAVEHTPTRWFSSKLDERGWHSSEQFLTLYVDYRVLKRVPDRGRRLTKRNSILEREGLTIEAIDTAVADH